MATQTKTASKNLRFWLLASVLSSGVLVIIVLLARQFVSMSETATSYAFLDHLTEFAQAHGDKLPESWEDFEAWGSPKSNAKWKAEQLKSLFDLPWGMRVSEVKQRPIIKVLSPKLNYLEKNLNATFCRRFNVKE